MLSSEATSDYRLGCMIREVKFAKHCVGVLREGGMFCSSRLYDLAGIHIL
jgi:hypothetical protein